MAMTMTDFKALLEKCNIRYFQHPSQPVVMAGFGGEHGSYQLTIGIQSEGRFLQFRTLNYAACRAESPHLAAVLRHLVGLNLQSRWVKWAWDPKDGEIMVMGDDWIMDGTVTVEQFNRMVANLVSVIDMEAGRLKTIIESGNDPGADEPSALVTRDTGGRSPPRPGTHEPVTEI